MVESIGVHESPLEVEFGETQIEAVAILSLVESIGVHESPWEVEFGKPFKYIVLCP